MGLFSSAVLSQDATAEVILHEVGHGVWLRLTTAAWLAWGNVHRATAWPDGYDSSNESESFDESFARWVRDPAGNPGAAAAFFAGLAADVRTG